ncbi:unnamed protein product [Vicia faba]|uniref:Uncharacterized protein n=1 Tax=Vicia faba TaxID=3906 RepID=A0AAV0YJG2_VICFA|nr:unnamed protein product [Vicia faba]
MLMGVLAVWRIQRVLSIEIVVFFLSGKKLCNSADKIEEEEQQFAFSDLIREVFLRFKIEIRSGFDLKLSYAKDFRSMHVKPLELTKAYGKTSSKLSGFGKHV